MKGASILKLNWYISDLKVKAVLPRSEAILARCDFWKFLD